MIRITTRTTNGHRFSSNCATQRGLEVYLDRARQNPMVTSVTVEQDGQTTVHAGGAK